MVVTLSCGSNGVRGGSPGDEFVQAGGISGRVGRVSAVGGVRSEWRGNSGVGTRVFSIVSANGCVVCGDSVCFGGSGSVARDCKGSGVETVAAVVSGGKTRTKDGVDVCGVVLGFKGPGESPGEGGGSRGTAPPPFSLLH